MIRPSTRAIAAAAAPAGVAALAALAWPPAAWLLGPIALAAVAAILADGIALGRVPLRAERPGAATLALGEWQPLEVEVRNPGRRALAVEAVAAWPPDFEVRRPAARARVGPGERGRLRWTVRPLRRGSYGVEAVRLRLDRGRAAQADRTVRLPQRIRVWPDTVEIVRCERRIRGPLGEGFGHRLTPALGKGREFEKLRDFGPDDDYRDIHWKATARRHRLTVREYRIDRSQDIVIGLETGHRMAARIGGLSALDHAVNAGLLLAYAAHRNEDKVGLVTFSSRIRAFVPAARGRAHMARCAEILYGLEPDGHHVAWRALVEELRARLRRRSLIVLFTDLADRDAARAFAAHIAGLRRWHVPLAVAVRDPKVEALARAIPRDRRELCRRIAASEEREHRRASIDGLRARGILVLDAAPEELSRGILMRYLEVKRRQLL